MANHQKYQNNLIGMKAPTITKKKNVIDYKGNK
jgi:hypothetical protein